MRISEPLQFNSVSVDRKLLSDTIFPIYSIVGLFYTARFLLRSQLSCLNLEYTTKAFAYTKFDSDSSSN